MIVSARDGDVKKVKDFLKSGAEVNAVDKVMII